MSADGRWRDVAELAGDILSIDGEGDSRKPLDLELGFDPKAGVACAEASEGLCGRVIFILREDCSWYLEEESHTQIERLIGQD